MALKVWLPLNGTNKNIGTSGIVMSGSPASWGDGKVASYAATFNNNTSNCIMEPSNQNSTLHFTTQDFSWATWVKKDYSAKTAGAMWAFTVGRADAGGYGYGMHVYSSTEVRVTFGSSGWVVSSVPDNQWHHIAFSRSGTKIKVYRDGVLVTDTTFAGNLPTYSDGYGLGVGCFHHSGYLYPLIGSVQDFRIYDHELSPLEVRELAEGMVYHYPLGNIHCTGTLNLYSGETARGKLNSGSKLSGEDGYKVTRTYTGTGENSWWFATAPNLAKTSFTVGKTYNWSVKYRVNKVQNMYLYFRNALYTNDTSTSGQKALDMAADHTWKTISSSYTITQADYDSTAHPMNPRIEIVSNNCNTSGTTYSLDIDFKEVQIVEAPSYQGWVDNATVSTLLQGGGAMQAALTRNGTVKNAASPVYGTAYDFNQAGYFSNAVLPITVDKFTMCFWLNPHSNSAQHFLVGTFDNWPNNGIGIYRNASQNKYTIVLRSTGASSYGAAYATVTLDTWSFVAITWDAHTISVYVNGTLQNSYSYGGNTSLFKNLYLGNSVYSSTAASETEEAAMSDFRLYSTCMSADRIKELYSVHTSITKTGTVVTSELAEGKSSISVRKSGQLRASSFASIPAIFGKEIRIEPDGSAWLKIVHHADPTSYLFASSDPFATGVYRDARRWFMGHVCSMVDRWEFMVELSADASSAVNKYRWVQQYDPNVATFANVAAASVTKYTTSQGYNTINSSYGGIYKKNSNAYYVANNNVESNWWGAIGSWTASSGGIPAYNGVVVVDGGYEDLWLRVDNVTWSASVGNVSFDRGGAGVRAADYFEN